MPSKFPYYLGQGLALLLLLLAVYFAWRQFKTWEWLRRESNLSEEDRRYHLRTVVRRGLGCVLLAALAMLLAGLFGMEIIDRLDELLAQGEQAKKEGRKLTAEESDFVYFSMRYVGTLALVLFGLLGVAFFDLLALRRFGSRHRKRIRDDRAAMLERQLPLLYREKREGLLRPKKEEENEPEEPST